MPVEVRLLPGTLNPNLCPHIIFLVRPCISCTFWNSFGSRLFHSASAASSTRKSCSGNADLGAVALLSLPLCPCLQGLEVELSNVPEMCPLSHGVSQSSPGFHATHSKCLNALPRLSIQLIKVYNSCSEQLLNLSAQNMLCSAGVPHSEFIKTWLYYHLFPSQELWELWHRRKTKKQNWHWFPCVHDLAPKTSNIATRVGFFLLFFICIALFIFLRLWFRLYAFFRVLCLYSK